MTDFFQNGVITTLGKLGHRSLESLEDELLKFAEDLRMTLILPALYSEFDEPAMPRIVEELSRVKYIHQIILGLDQADRNQFNQARKFMARLPVTVDILWHDGPRLKAVYQQLRDAGFAGLDVRGKGRNVWQCIGYALSDLNNYAIALHDCDIINYNREIPARLFYPVVNPVLDYEFNKAYYARVNDKLHGRVTRLFLTPLLSALRKTVGPSPYLDYMASFRYALSGEIAFIRSLARSIRISPTWGLEVSTISEVFNDTSTTRVCQSEVIDNYSHKHQPLSGDDSSKGLAKMANDIALVLFQTMSKGGVIFSYSVFNTLVATYFQEARHAVTKYNTLAKINGLPYSRMEEIEAIGAFERALDTARKSFCKNPMGVPCMSAWSTVRSALPNLFADFRTAVEEDNR